MVRLAMDVVEGDTRAIYGKTGKWTGRVNMRGENLAELHAMHRTCFFRPNGKGRSVQFRQAWDLVQIFMLFYVALVVPFRIGFHAEAEPSHWAFWWEVIVDLYFWCDILLNFRTAFYDEIGELVIARKKICVKYLRGWFLLDFLSCLPVTYIGLILNKSGKAETGDELKMFRVFRVLRLAKLLRLGRIKRLLGRLEQQYRFLAKGSRVAAIVATILFSAHLVACSWHLAGSSGMQVLGTDRVTGEAERLQPWVMAMYGGIGDGSTVNPDFDNGLQVSTMTRYVDALYYSVTTLTTVGYGDRVPSTDLEKVMSILCELAGSVIFGVIAGSLSTLAMAESMTRAEIKQQLSQLEELMEAKNVPGVMRARISDQMSYWFEKKSVFDEEMLLSYLPPRQRKDLLIMIYKPLLAHCPLLQGLEWPVVSKMCLMMRPYLAVVDDVIFSEGDAGDEMYLVVRGAVRLSSNAFPVYNTRMWEDGAFFGELPLLNCGGKSSAASKSNKHVYSATALVESDLSYLTQEDFEELSLQHVTLKATMRSHALRRAIRFGTNSAAKTLADVSTWSNSPNSPKWSPRSNSSNSPKMSPRNFKTPEDKWFLAAQKVAPHLLGEEIEDLRKVFLQYASKPKVEGKEELSIDAMQRLLDDSMKQMFDKLDDDGSGSLEKPEIERMLTLLGLPAEEKERMIADLDVDGSGEVEYQEFKAWWDKVQYVTDENREREVKDMFDAVDTDRSGLIDWEEFMHLVSSHVLRGREIEHASSPVSSADDNSEQRLRDATEMVRLALNTVREDTRAIYGSIIRANTRKLTVELHDVATKKRCFFRPDGSGASVKCRQAWDLAQVFVLFYVALLVPFRVGFSQDAVTFSGWFWWEVLIDIYFWVDIVLNFRTAHYDADGVLVVEQKAICAKYAQGWFLLDLVSCLPVRYIEMILYGPDDQEGSDLIALKAFRLLRMAKLLRLARVQRLFRRLETQYAGLSRSGRLAKICFTILISAHFVACIWYWMGAGEDQRLGVNAEGEEVVLQPWVRQLYGNIEEGGCTESGVEVPSFECDRLSKYSVSLATKYLDALYYSVTTLTTVGYGDRVPNTDGEKMFSILCELAGSVTFGIIAGSLSALAMSESMTRRKIKERSTKLDEFMRTKNVPRRMREDIGAQLSNYFEKKSALDEKQIIACLPPKHQKDLVMAIYEPYVVDCPLLQGLERGLKSRLCLAMRPYFALAGDDIVVEGEMGEEMYLITRGTVKLDSSRYPAYNSRQWEDGAFFGELPLLDCGAEQPAGPSHSVSQYKAKDKPRRVLHVYTAKALSDAHCTYITRQDFDELNHNRPDLKQTMRKFAMQRAERFGMDTSVIERADAGSDDTFIKLTSSVSGEIGIVQLVENARQHLLEARQEADLKNFDARTKASFEKLLAVEGHLEHIKQTAERMVQKRTKDRAGGPGA